MGAKNWVVFLQEPPSTLAETRMGVDFISRKRTPSEGLGARF